MVIGKDIHQQDHLPAGLYLPFAPIHFVPPLKRLRGKLRQLSPTVDTCCPFNEPFHSLPAAHKVHRPGKQRSNRVELLRMPKEVVRYRRSMLFMPAMGKFRLHLCHIHMGRAFAFTRLAAKAELQCLFQILRPESVCFFSGEQLTEKICTATCGVLLFACCVVGGAHCSSRRSPFTAHSRTLAPPHSR